MRRAERARSHSSAAAGASRVERRRAAVKRRNRTMFIGSMLIAALVLVAWFPASDLLHQHDQLAAATSELRSLDQKNQALKEKATELVTPIQVGRVAQTQYGLVAIGDQAYQVLPASGTKDKSLTSMPNSSPSKSGAQDAQHVQARSIAHLQATRTHESFMSRILQTLEFWR